MFALPIFPGSRPPSIVGVYELNFCVRDGERWERCRRQIQRPERVAAVGEGRRCTVTEDIRRVPQQETGGRSTCSHTKKRARISPDSLCSRYLFSWVDQVLSCRPQVSGGHLQAYVLFILSKKKTSNRSWRSVFALPIFPGSHPPSIVGVHELNFCVRDGNRWTLITINTNYSIY